MRADGSQVEELIRKLKDAKMDATVSDEDAKKAAAAYASGTKVAVASVTDASGTETLEVRKDKRQELLRQAAAGCTDGIYKVTADLGDGLDKKVDDFRNKKLFDFGWTDPNKVEVGKVTLEKSGDKWMSGAKQMDCAFGAERGR